MSVPIVTNGVPILRPQPYRPSPITPPYHAQSPIPPLPPPPPPLISRRQPTSRSETTLSDRICVQPSLPYNMSLPRLTSGSAVTTLSGRTSPTGSQPTMRQMSKQRTYESSIISTPSLSQTPGNWSRDEANGQTSTPPKVGRGGHTNGSDRQTSRFSRIHSRPSLAGMRRVVSYHATRRQRSENTDSDCEAVVAARRTATATQNDWAKRKACFVKDQDDDNEIVLQGYCRMPRFAKLRKTRFLRLVRRQLECFDSRLRKLLWSVVLDGARVRIQTKQHKITLSKLQCGYLIEFFVYDEQSCKDWAAALLRASMLASMQRKRSPERTVER